MESRSIHQWLQALRWVMTQPGLLDGLPGGSAPLMAGDDPRLLQLLRITEEDPTGLFRLLDGPRGHKVGITFEALLQWGLEAGLGYRCIARDVQIMEDKRTVGALDLILLSPAGKTEHWELAYKLFLQADSGTGWESWLGPGGRDRLDKKVHRMLDHQLPLSSREVTGQVLSALGVESVTTRRLMLQGVLFTALGSDSIRATQGHQPAQGRWARASQVRGLVEARNDSMWVQRHKPLWFGPWAGEISQALCGEQLCREIDSASLDRSQLWSCLGSGEHSDEELVFIVPDDWGF